MKIDCRGGHAELCTGVSAEGTPRSISHYNTIGTINSKKTDEELTQLTTI